MILNFPQRDCLRTRKVSKLHCLQSYWLSFPLFMSNHCNKLSIKVLKHTIFSTKLPHWHRILVIFRMYGWVPKEMQFWIYIWSQKWANLDLGWVKVMCDEFGEVLGIIDLVFNFLAAGTLFLNSYDTLSYEIQHFPNSNSNGRPSYIRAKHISNMLNNRKSFFVQFILNLLSIYFQTRFLLSIYLQFTFKLVFATNHHWFGF